MAELVVSRKKVNDYKRLGGVIRLPRDMLKSEAYKNLSLAARELITTLQLLWSPGIESLHFSSRRAGEHLGVSHATGARALNELVEKGFLLKEKESDWMNGKAREWKLTWESMGRREPTDEWKYWNGEN